MSRHGQTGYGRDLFVSFNKEGVSAMTCTADAELEVEVVKNNQVCLVVLFVANIINRTFFKASSKGAYEGRSQPVYAIIPMRTCKIISPDVFTPRLAGHVIWMQP